jgi:A/G-specific adenine glycosylase
MIESEKGLTFDELSQTFFLKKWLSDEIICDFRLIVKNRKHILSHRILYANFYEIQLEQLPVTPAKLIRIAQAEMDNYPVHRLMQFYLDGR